MAGRDQASFLKLSETAFFDARWLARDSRCCPGEAVITQLTQINMVLPSGLHISRFTGYIATLHACPVGACPMGEIRIAARRGSSTFVALYLCHFVPYSFPLTGWGMGGNLGLEVGGCDLKVPGKTGCEVGYPGVLLGGDLGSCGFVILIPNEISVSGSDELEVLG